LRYTNSIDKEVYVKLRPFSSPRKVQASVDLNPEFFAERFELNDEFQA